jgi:hypothetical protein
VREREKERGGEREREREGEREKERENVRTLLGKREGQILFGHDTQNTPRDVLNDERSSLDFPRKEKK